MNAKTTRKLFKKLTCKTTYAWFNLTSSPPPPPPPPPPRFLFFVLGGLFLTPGINAERDNSPPRAPDQPHKTCFWGTSL